MPAPKSKWPLPPRQTIEPEPPLWEGLWRSIVHSGLRAPIMRYAGHVLIIGVVVVAAWLARFALWDLLPAQIKINPASPAETTSSAATHNSSLPLPREDSSERTINRLINFHTYMPSRPRSEVEVYSVLAGDSLFAIANKFNLQPETILWSNYTALKDDPDLITPAQELFILPIDGLYYQWQAGGRLDIVAENYGVNVVDIVSWPGNHLDPGIHLENPDIGQGTWLVIPGGHREFVQWRVPQLIRTDDMKWFYAGPGTCRGGYLSTVQGYGSFIWPSASRNTSRGNPYGAYHHAIDISEKTGNPIYATDNGVVVFSGESTWGYGNLVVIDHGNGWQSVYAHLSQILLGCGADVYQGDQLGMAGSTGNSTGPHLHFELTINGAYVNPLNYLP